VRSEDKAWDREQEEEDYPWRLVLVAGTNDAGTAAGKRLSRRCGGGGDRNGIIKEINGNWDKCRRGTLTCSRKSRDCHDRRIFLGVVFCLVHSGNRRFVTFQGRATTRLHHRARQPASAGSSSSSMHPIHYCQTFAPTPGKSSPSRRDGYATWNLLFLDWAVVNTYFLMKHMASSFTGLQYYTSANWGLRH
jgi:hypothetical protein